jgi:lactoylglutathione lyase
MKVLINVDVPDLAQAQAFYTVAFGWVAGRRLGGQVQELLGPDVPVYLLCKHAGTQGAGSSQRDYGRHWTPVHADLVVEDLDTALQRALGAGARLEGEVRAAAWGRIAQLADPYGHGWCLIEFTDRGYDAIADA